jgi:hypothetical protein
MKDDKVLIGIIQCELGILPTSVDRKIPKQFMCVVYAPQISVVIEKFASIYPKMHQPSAVADRDRDISVTEESWERPDGNANHNPATDVSENYWKPFYAPTGVQSLVTTAGSGLVSTVTENAYAADVVRFA